MRYIVVDVEATCWRPRSPEQRPEIIEVGAVELAAATGPAEREFASFVRPAVNPFLSDFCRELTGIQQHEVDLAPRFPALLGAFVQWIGLEPFVLCSWGQYDLNQFASDCRQHRMELPPTFLQHVNLKQEFAAQRRVARCGMAKALTILGWPLQGRHHRGIDDARNIARIATVVLPSLSR